jgi:hypothetical protein
MSWCNDAFVSWHIYIVDPLVHYININNFQLATIISFIHTVDTAISCINTWNSSAYWKLVVNIDGFLTEPKYVATTS